jgi:hypothetical protein
VQSLHKLCEKERKASIKPLQERIEFLLIHSLEPGLEALAEESADAGKEQRKNDDEGERHG